MPPKKKKRERSKGDTSINNRLLDSVGGEGGDDWANRIEIYTFSLVQSLSHIRLCDPIWTAACQASLSITNSELAQTPVHKVGDAIKPSHPLLSPSPPTFNLSQHQGLFQWVSSSHQVAKVLECFAISFSRGSSYPGIEPRSPALQVNSLPAEPQGKPNY